MAAYFFYQPCPGCGPSVQPWTSNAIEEVFQEGSAVQFPDGNHPDCCFTVTTVELEIPPAGNIKFDWNDNPPNFNTFVDCEECEGAVKSEDCADCPAGYTLVGDICEKITIVPADCPNELIPVCKGFAIFGNYGKFSARFYEPDYSDFSKFPLNKGQNTTQVKYADFTDLNPVIELNPGDPGHTNIWRDKLNTIGVWGPNKLVPGTGPAFGVAPEYECHPIDACELVYNGCNPNSECDNFGQNQISCNMQPLTSWLGFTTCVEVTESKFYSVFVAGDNKVRFGVNGQEYFIMDGTSGGTSAFQHSWIFQIELSPGTHVISLEGFNDTSVAAFGCEVYTAPVAEIATYTTELELDAVTIFSSYDLIGTEVFDLGITEAGDDLGCTCPEGFVLSDCDGELECIKVETTEPTSCCYRLDPCDGGDPIYTETDLSSYIPASEKIGLASIILTPCCGGETLETVLSDPSISIDWTLDPSKVIKFNNECYTISNGTFGGFLDLGEQPPGFVQTPTDAEVTVLNATSCPDAAIEDVECDCGGEETEVIPAPIFGVVLELQGLEGCWTMSIPPAGECVNPFPVVVTNASNTNCDDCVIGYELRDCKDSSNVIYTETDLSQFVASSEVIQIFQYPGFCFQVFQANEAVPNPIEVWPTVSYISCEECNLTQYLLEDCAGNEPSFITNSDLEQYVGGVVNLQFCPEVCWTVSEAPQVTQDPQTVVVENSYSDCESCYPEPEPEVEVTYKYRSVQPGYCTPGCSKEFYEKVTCKYADAMYKKMVGLRYGIEMCCQDDIDKIRRDKAILDNKVLETPCDGLAILPKCQSYVLDRAPQAQSTATVVYRDCEGRLVSYTENIGEDGACYQFCAWPEPAPAVTINSVLTDDEYYTLEPLRDCSEENDVETCLGAGVVISDFDAPSDIPDDIEVIITYVNCAGQLVTEIFTKDDFQCTDIQEKVFCGILFCVDGAESSLDQLELTSNLGPGVKVRVTFGKGDGEGGFVPCTC